LKSDLRQALSTSRSAQLHAGFFDDLIFNPFDAKKMTTEELIGSVANPAGFTDAELLAMKEASISDEAPGRKFPNLNDAPLGEQYDTNPAAPDSLFADSGPGFPMTYFNIFRGVQYRATGPPPEVWPYVRKRWPVLAEKTDEELVEALGPIKAVEVDARNL